jgi:hypothetical protein
MTVFDNALEALFADPNLAEDALWRPGGSGPGRPVRVIRVDPRARVDIGAVALVEEGVLFDALVTGEEAPVEGDTIEVAGMIYRIQAPPVPESLGRIRRLDTRKL